MKRSWMLFAAYCLIFILPFFPHLGASAQDTDSKILDIDWSPDGSKIALTTSEGIRLYDRDFNPLGYFPYARDPDINVPVIWPYAFWSPDSSRITAGAQILDAETLKPVVTTQATTPLVQWTPDGKYVLASSGDYFAIEFYDAQNGNLVRKLPHPEYQLGVPELDRTGMYFLLTPNVDAIAIADVASGEILTRYDFPYRINALSWSPDSKRIAYASSERVPLSTPGSLPSAGTDLGLLLHFYVIDTATGATLVKSEPLTNLLVSLDWSPDGATLVGNLALREIVAWDSTTGKQLQSYVLPRGKLAHPGAYDPSSGRYLIALADTDIQFDNRPDDLPDNSASIVTQTFLDGRIQILDMSGSATSTPSPPPQPDAQTLRDILTAPNCQIACLLGIEPGVTNHADLENILNRLGIPFESRPIGNAGMITSYNFDASIDSPFIPNGHEPIGVLLSPNQVEQVDFEVTGVTVQDIINWYGAPASVGNVGTNVLVYPDLGLIFFVSDADHNSVFLVYLRTQAGVEGAFMGTAPCTGPSSLCSIATATLPAAPSNDPRTLRDLLSYPTCQGTCFMGIEPGVTTQAELENLLNQYQLEFTQSSIASGHLIIYTIVPSSNAFLSSDKPVYLDVTADHVDLLTLFLQNVTAEQLTIAFGAPDAIVGSGRGSNFIVYVEKGLIFGTRSADSDAISAVFVTSPGRDALRMDYYLTDSAPCSGSIDVCAIATATPTPQSSESNPG